MKDFASKLLIRAIEEYEDRLLARKAQERLDEMDENQKIDFDDACRLAGWDDVEEI